MAIDITSYAPALQLGEDAVWFAADHGAVSYPEEGNDLCFAIEDKSFWFRHRNACLSVLVKRFPPRDKGAIFDVGGGNGFVAKGLVDAGWEVVLVEPGLAGARNAKARGLAHVVCATTQSAGFRVGCMPAIGVFDVVEHIEDDTAFVRHLAELLETQGLVYITVPAMQWLWSEEDVFAGHFRRYSKKQLRQLLEEAGLRVEFISTFFSWLVVPVFLGRSLPSLFRGKTTAVVRAEKMATEHSLPASILPFVDAVHRWELNRLSLGQGIAIGSSIVCVARKV